MSDKKHEAMHQHKEASLLDAVGIGSMVVDRLHRCPQILGGDQKGILRSVESQGPVRISAGGVVLNHLGWASALGLRTGIFGKQADDGNGRFLRSAMDRLGIEQNLTLDGSATSLSEVFVDDAGARAIYMAPGATAEITVDDLHKNHGSFLQRATRLTTEISQLPLAVALEALALARAAGLKTVVDLDVPLADAVPKLGEEETFYKILRSADLLKPSKSAARELVEDKNADALALARAIQKRFGNQVVVTDGEAGCAIATEDFSGVIPAYPAKAVDSTGAGDAFLGGLLVGLHHGLSWPDAAKLANACGAACVEQIGAFPNDPLAVRARVIELYDGAPFAMASLHAKELEEAPRHEAAATFATVVEELASLERRLDTEAFDRAIDLILESERRGGRVHVTGIGKPEHVAAYMASLLASTGTPATFLHGTEAVHGSAGQVVSGDVVIAISNSGETQELLAAVKVVKVLGAKVIAVTGKRSSPLAGLAEVVLDAGVAREGGGLGFAPRASIVAEITVLGALAAALEARRGFTRAQYHARHPAGKLGEITRSLEKPEKSESDKSPNDVG